MFDLVKEESRTMTRPPVPTNNPHDLPLPRELVHHNTTAANQVLGLPGMFSTFNHNQLRRLRIVAITSSALSLVVGIVGIFCLINIDRRRKVFRHDLLFFLIFCGFIKALVLMIYPMVILIRDSVYFNPYFFNILGWFTAYTVEGSDLAIFFFAVHFALLIFRPSRKWRNRRTGNLEGGLYRLRALIWPLTGSIPLLLASLAFVNFITIDEKRLLKETTVVYYNQRYPAKSYARIGGYKPYSAWCYLPPYPLWYKLVLSWGPRYFLIIFILTLYAAIYGFVLKESRKIKRDLGDFRKDGDLEEATKRRNSVKNKSVKTLNILVQPVLAVLSAVKSLILSTDDSSEPERDVSGAGTLEHGAQHSFFDGINQDTCRRNYEQEQSGISDNESNNNGKIGDSGTISPSRRQPKRNLRQHNIDSIIQEDPESFDEEANAHDTEDLFRALTDPNGVRDENRASPIDPDHQLRPSNSRTGMSPIQSIFGPFTKNTNSERSESYSDQKKEEVNDVQADFQRHTYAEMKKRRLQIQKNVKLIFIYPFSYIAIWIFPLIVDITQYRYEIAHGPVVWLAYIATIVQPLNCFVDTLVFLFRERPWKYSWREVESKELMDAYMLKGELGESDMMDLCSSRLGRKGWYFRGIYERKECWRHQPSIWKRTAWYIYRFVKGVIENNYSFEDNCNNEEYWNQYYFANSKTRNGNTQKQLSVQKERQFSFPSDSTTLSDTAAQNNHINASRRVSVANESEYRKISLFWKVIHFLPMLKAIDLDELNRQIRLKSKDEEFIIPGLQVALGAGHMNDNNTNNATTGQNNVAESSPSLFKPGYSLSPDKPDEDEGLPVRWNPSAEDLQHNPNNNSTLDGEGRSRNGTGDPTSINMDFSESTNSTSRWPTSKKPSMATVSQDDGMDMLAFLKGPAV